MSGSIGSFGVALSLYLLPGGAGLSRSYCLATSDYGDVGRCCGPRKSRVEAQCWRLAKENIRIVGSLMKAINKLYRHEAGYHLPCWLFIFPIRACISITPHKLHGGVQRYGI